ncbi:MAG: type II toxin-antitoxin system RelE/ParE family toxin [Spirochaetaceae bacterium]|jgi:putative addiction module killer protein|nr:type II toxin-antitoxin system RelE/ParE family toxin [Spirochaetaceae bacterium]
MESKPIEVLVYEDEAGKEPFTGYLQSCDSTVRARIFSRLDRVEQGNWGDCELVGDKVFELRMHFGPGYRVYFGKIEDVVVLLLTAGKKSSQKQDIKKSKKYWKEFQRREAK